MNITAPTTGTISFSDEDITNISTVANLITTIDDTLGKYRELEPTSYHTCDAITRDELLTTLNVLYRLKLMTKVLY